MSYKLPCEKKHRRVPGPASRRTTLGSRNRRIVRVVPIIVAKVVLNKLGRVHRRVRTQIGEREYHATKGWREHRWSEANHVRL